mmetsp:Transcript_4844/g.14460  ORF Transcript_4844/g.14460 Transcript_4844/m.14460 type:complete len:100 (-) Transcript_4844:630-929(-)
MPIFTNRPLVAALLSFFFAQVAKVFTTWYLDRKWDLTRLVGSGGMPSSHSAFVVGLCTAVGFASGTSSVEFAVCFVFSAIVSSSRTRSGELDLGLEGGT